jgi:hypothetical protein
MSKAKIKAKQEYSLLQQNILNECRDLAQLLIAKNSDYGSAFAESPILLPNLDAKSGILIRMSDKIKRIRELLQNNLVGKVKKETILETFEDLAGYCILYIVSSK